MYPIKSFLHYLGEERLQMSICMMDSSFGDKLYTISKNVNHFRFLGNEKDDLPNQAPQSPPPRKSLVHPLDQHKLLYILHYDSQLTLYAFSTLQTILMRAPHQFVCASSTTSISSSNTPHQEKIKELLIRHRRSLLGKGFYGALYDSPVSPTGRWEFSECLKYLF